MIDNTMLMIAILFFPGIITVSILQLFKKRGEPYSAIQLLLYSFIFGMINNLLIYGFAFRKEIPIVNYLNQSLKETSNQINEFNTSNKEFFISLIVSIILGLILSWLRNRGLLHSFLGKYHITYETGFQSMLDLVYHSPAQNFSLLRKSHVTIKNLDNKEIFEGFVAGTEIQDTYVEFILFNNYEKGDPPLYLQLEKGKFSIEYKVSDDDQDDISESIMLNIKYVFLFTILLIPIIVLVYIIVILIK